MTNPKSVEQVTEEQTEAVNDHEIRYSYFNSNVQLVMDHSNIWLRGSDIATFLESSEEQTVAVPDNDVCNSLCNSNVQVVMDDDNIWFKASDIASVMRCRDSRGAVLNHYPRYSNRYKYFVVNSFQHHS
jgi:prophage antirepressor-like protein